VVVTMLEARINPDKAGELRHEYEKLGDPPPIIVESFLLNTPDNRIWRLVTVFRSREDLEDMRESMRAADQAPPGVRVFQAVGVEPTLTIFDVAAHLGR